ncbi:MAG: mechanosensitive ion channel family protein [Sodaliphilus sp.]
MNTHLLLQTTLPVADTAKVAKMQSVLHPDSILAKTPTSVDELKNFPWTEMFHNITSQLVEFFFHLCIAVLVFCVGKFIIKKLHNIFKAILQRRNVEPSLTTFLLSLLRITLMFVLIVIVVGILGVETSSFIALFASAGVAVGMALSGTLQNFAGGVLILLLKPFKVGDYIEYGDYKGYVREIQIFHTIITTFSNERIVIPNGGLSTGIINNFSFEPYHRVEWKVSVAYGTDVDKAKSVILGIVKKDERVLQQAPEGVASAVQPPVVALDELGSSEVVLVVRVWAATADYWGVKYDLGEQIYTQLPKQGIEFPFPQLDVHIKK